MRTTSRVAIAAALASPLVLLALAGALPESALVVALVVNGVSVLVISAVMVRVARSGDAQLRRARLWFAASLGSAAAGFAAAAGYAAVLGEVPVVSPVTLAPLAWVPCALLGLLSVPTRGHRERGAPRSLLDGLIVASGTGLAFWVLFLEPLWTSEVLTGAEKAILLAYPVIDLVLAVVALSVAAQARAGLRRFLHLVTLGLLLVAVADAANAVHSADGAPGFGWTDVVLQAGLAVLFCAAVTPTVSERDDDSRLATLVDALLPYVPVTVGLSVAAVQAHVTGEVHTPVLVLSTVMVFGLVVRQAAYASSISRLAHKLSVDAARDALTELVNRRACLDGLASWLAEAPPGHVAVVLFDLDGFKEVNDGFGHAAGDLALRDFATRLAGVAGDDAVAARLGGDEFALLLVGPDAGRRATASAAQLVTGQRSQIGAVSLAVGASAGVAASEDGDTTSTLLRRADLALYEAKRSRDSAVVGYAPDMTVRAERRHLLTQALPGAAARGELHLVYQPLLCLHDRSLTGVEALLRWTHPEYGAVSPAEFVPLAEETGVISEIGRWVLAQAGADLARWPGEPSVFVNVSARQLDDAFPADAVRLLADSGVAPSRVVLEITESAMPDLSADRCLGQLRAAGFQLAMDDFGAGFSSLAQLAVLPVDVLKFDREFLRGMHTDNGRRIVDGIVAIARDLGLLTVAEGVETAFEADLAQAAGCSLAQGYLFAPPMPAEDVRALLAARVPLPRPSADALAASA